MFTPSRQMRLCIRRRCEAPATVFPNIQIPLSGKSDDLAFKVPAKDFTLCEGCAGKMHVGEFIKNGGRFRTFINRFCKKAGATADFKNATLEFERL